MDEKVRSGMLDKLYLSRFNLQRLKDKKYFDRYSEIADMGGYLATDLSAKIAEYRKNGVKLELDVLQKINEGITHFNQSCLEFSNGCLDYSKLPK